MYPPLSTHTHLALLLQCQKHTPFQSQNGLICDSTRQVSCHHIRHTTHTHTHNTHTHTHTTHTTHKHTHNTHKPTHSLAPTCLNGVVLSRGVLGEEVSPLPVQFAGHVAVLQLDGCRRQGKTLHTPFTNLTQHSEWLSRRLWHSHSSGEVIHTANTPLYNGSRPRMRMTSVLRWPAVERVPAAHGTDMPCCWGSIVHTTKVTAGTGRGGGGGRNVSINKINGHLIIL